MSVVTKVVMQMNAKMGGELWSVHIPMKKVMYVGIDTYHDSGSSRSVGGIVASMNDACTRYVVRDFCSFTYTFSSPVQILPN